MSTKTPNFNLNKTELTDTIQNTILGNNENFDIIDQTLKDLTETNTYTLPTEGESQTIETLYGNYILTNNGGGIKTTVMSGILTSNNPRITGIVSSDITMLDTSLENTAFNLTVGDITKRIYFGQGEGIYDYDIVISDIEEDFQNKIDTAFGSGKVKIKLEDLFPAYMVSIKCAEDAERLPITVTSGNDETLGLSDMLPLLNIASGSTNVFDTNITINNFLGKSATEITLTINDYSETLSADLTLQNMFDKINNSETDLTIAYSFYDDVFVITDLADEITFSDDLELFRALGFTSTTETTEEIYLVDINSPNNGTIQNIKLSKSNFDKEGVLALLSILEDNNRAKIEELKNIIESLEERISLLEGGAS